MHLPPIPVSLSFADHRRRMLLAIAQLTVMDDRAAVIARIAAAESNAATASLPLRATYYQILLADGRQALGLPKERALPALLAPR